MAYHYSPKNILITGGCGFIGSLVNNAPSCEFFACCLIQTGADSHFRMYQVQNYPQYNFINLNLLDTCATTNTLLPIERFSNYTFVGGDIGNMNLVPIFPFYRKIEYILYVVSVLLSGIIVDMTFTPYFAVYSNFRSLIL